jgi:CheY-like chemotaxis protein
MEPIDILLVEDNPGDVRLTRESLLDAKVPSRLHVVDDGHQALAFLRRQGRYSEAVRPRLILLDLNLPGKDGREVLAEIKGDPELKLIPIVVLTSSAAAADVRAAYDLHANCYVTKLLDFQQFRRLVHLIDEFWLSAVKLPPVNGS